MRRGVTGEEILFIVKLILIAKSVHELHLKVSKQIAFANSPEPLFEYVYLSAPEPRTSISTLQTKTVLPVCINTNSFAKF